MLKKIIYYIYIDNKNNLILKYYQLHSIHNEAKMSLETKQPKGLT